MTTSEEITPMACLIVHKTCPEWGNYSVLDDCGDYFIIYNRGVEILSKQEADEFWEVVK